MRIVDELGKAAVLDLGEVVIDVIAAQGVRRDLVSRQVLPKERIHELDIRGDDVVRVRAGEALIGNNNGLVHAVPSHNTSVAAGRLERRCLRLGTIKAMRSSGRLQTSCSGRSA